MHLFIFHQCRRNFLVWILIQIQYYVHEVSGFIRVGFGTDELLQDAFKYVLSIAIIHICHTNLTSDLSKKPFDTIPSLRLTYMIIFSSLIQFRPNQIFFVKINMGQGLNVITKYSKGCKFMK